MDQANRFIDRKIAFRHITGNQITLKGFVIVRHVSGLAKCPGNMRATDGPPGQFAHLIRIDRGSIVTSPIKGTRPRSPDPAEDRRQARELLASAKDRAENVMIADLLRNDLGKSCMPGSIHADALFELQSHANVHHLVSTISGQLRHGTSAPEAFKRAFPGGSITGAPKHRAMNIINEVEPVARTAYCGSVFYYSNHGRFDSNITIRSLLADHDTIHCWGGGGIVADSIPELEYAEGWTKIRILLDTLSAL